MIDHVREFIAQQSGNGYTIPTEAWKEGGFFILLLIGLYGLYKLFHFLIEKAAIPLATAGVEWMKSSEKRGQEHTLVLHELVGSTKKNTEATEKLIDAAKETSRSQQETQKILQQHQVVLQQHSQGQEQMLRANEEMIRRLKKTNPSIDSDVKPGHEAGPNVGGAF